MLQIILTLAIFVILVNPMGKYMYHIATKQKTFADKVFNPIDRCIYKVCGIKGEDMGWKKYALTLLLVNAVMVFVGYAILRLQSILFLNPNGISNMEPTLSFNTIISFMTNTNLQHYSGESGLSYAAQMCVIIFMMFTSAATGYAACMAFCRGLAGKKMGNFYEDMVRITTRILIPVSFIVGLLLVSQGTPQTLQGNFTIETLVGNFQDIAVGPVAALESIKHLGTNGGGFFGANSTTPFENPTVISNIIEMISMMILPGACVVTFGHMLHDKRKEKKAENIKEKRTAKTEPKTEEIVIPIQRKLWRLLKPLLTYELFLIGATVLLALILMTFTTGGYLEERMHATSVLASAIGSLAAIPVLWKQYKKDEGMFPKPEKRWSAAEAAACILLVMTFGHLLNTVMNVTGFTRIFSGYQDMASKIYEGQNPLLLILSVGVLSAAAEEIVFRGMIYRRAKDFWGTGWGIAASCLLFGAYHGNVTQFVYAAVVSVLLILIYERCGTLLAPVLAHMAENIWGLYRSQFVSWMTQKAPAGAWMFVFLEAVICAGTFWYLFLKDKQGKTQK